MPHKWFICPDATQPLRDRESQVEIPDCLNCALTRTERQCNYNPTLLKLMVEQDEQRYSPTRLSRCPRQIALKQRYDYAVNPATAFPKVRGTMFHAGLEAHADPDGQVEEELQRTFQLRLVPSRRTVKVLIKGRADLIYPAQQLVVDWKTMAYVPVRNNLEKPEKDLPKREHVIQLSVYGWLAQGKGWAVRKGEIIYLDMSKVRREVVDLWPHELVEVYLSERLPSLVQAYNPRAELPPILDETDPDYWQCRTCEVSTLCENIGYLEGDD